MGKFALPTSKGKKPEKLSDAKRKELQLVFKDVTLITIDEYSMCSAGILHSINSRLREIAVTPEAAGQPFGERSMLLVGDSSQLSPVYGTSLCTPVSAVAASKSAARDGLSVFQQCFKQAVFLTKKERQAVAAGDIVQEHFVRALDNLANGVAVVSDWEFLNTRTPLHLGQVAFSSHFKDAV